MILKPVVIKYIDYLSDWRRYVLETQQGLTNLRNLLYVLPDRRLYFQDNGNVEYCLTHPDYTTLQNVPASFTPSYHLHDEHSLVGHTHSQYAPVDHTHETGSTVGDKLFLYQSCT